MAETVPAGWRLDGATCSDGSDPASVRVGPGENVTCTFANTKLDTIAIDQAGRGRRRDLCLHQPGPWATSAWPCATARRSGASATWRRAPTPCRDALAGWTPTVADPVCSNGDNASSINLAAGETVVCVFVNLKQDTIVVEKTHRRRRWQLHLRQPAVGRFRPDHNGRRSEPVLHQPAAGNLQHQRDRAGGLGADRRDLRQGGSAGQHQLARRLRR